MKPPIIIAILLVALLVAGVLVMDRFDPDTAPVQRGEPSPTTEASDGHSPSDHSGDPAFGDNDSSTLAPGRVFRCTVESVDPLRSNDDESTMEERAQRAEERHDSFVERLSASGDLNHQLTVGLMQSGESSPLAIETLAPLLTSMPESELLHWRLLEACDVRPTHPVCADGNAETRSIAVLGSNGAFWAKVAYFRAKRGDNAGALEALRSAVAAEEFRDYWGAEVALVFDSLAIESDIGTTERLIAANGVSAAIHRPGIHLFNTCRTNAAESTDWADACIAYGQRREQDSQTLIGRGIGIGLQASMLTLLGDDEAAAAVRSREARVTEMLRDPVMRDGEVLLMTDESVALEWLQHLQIYGELSAREFLRSEVERVSRIPGYDPCPPREAQP